MTRARFFDRGRTAPPPRRSLGLGGALWALSGLWAGCDKPAPDEFAEEFPAHLCDWVETCATGGEGDLGPAEDAYDCEGEALDFVEQAEGDTRCAYDAGQARQCLEALEGACEERTAIYYECKRVYRGDECPNDLSTLL